MRIHDIMSTKIITVSASDVAEQARNLMRDNGIHHLVITQGHRLLGVLSDRDVNGQSSTAPVGAFMTKDVATIAPDATLREAAGMMDGSIIGCLPVMKDGELQGIVTMRDLVHALAKGSMRPPASTERVILRKRGPRKRPQPPV